MRWARYPAVDAGDAEQGHHRRLQPGGQQRTPSTPSEAFEAALCLRNAEHQKFSAINDGVPPTIESVYDDPEMAEAYPMKDVILEELRDAGRSGR